MLDSSRPSCFIISIKSNLFFSFNSINTSIHCNPNFSSVPMPPSCLITVQYLYTFVWEEGKIDIIHYITQQIVLDRVVWLALVGDELQLMMWLVADEQMLPLEGKSTWCDVGDERMVWLEVDERSRWGDKAMRWWFDWDWMSWWANEPASNKSNTQYMQI